MAVSYTHLDVYKRQVEASAILCDTMCQNDSVAKQNVTPACGRPKAAHRCRSFGTRDVGRPRAKRYRILSSRNRQCAYTVK